MAQKAQSMTTTESGQTNHTEQETESEGNALHEGSSDDQMLTKRGYTLGRLLGEGSYAKVYITEFSDPASTTNPKHTLACKIVNGSKAPKEFLKKFFPREIEIMSRVNHQNLVKVHSILERKSKFFLFMQFCENGDLLEFVKTNGAIREKQSRVWLCQIMRGLNYLHERNIAHRDLKCENILLTKSFNCKITDFGFARYFLPNQDKSNTFCGSVSYAPPEIIRGHVYDPKLADLWSIGIILFVMLNKALPFQDKNLKLLYECQKGRNWKYRSKTKDLLSGEVKFFLYILLEPIPEKRKPIPDLLLEPWIQAGSNLNLTLTQEIHSQTAIHQSITTKQALQERTKVTLGETPAAHISSLPSTAVILHPSAITTTSDSDKS